MTDTIQICNVCFRTDAFTPGTIQHDPKWHIRLTYLRGWNYQNTDWRERIMKEKYKQTQKFDLSNLK